MFFPLHSLSSLLYLSICLSLFLNLSGREDVDVRMLGRGRPFVLEISDPHRVTFTEEEVLSLFPMVNW
jgi:tRNA U54 and U55 pseudouridine synthase Pus10